MSANKKFVTLQKNNNQIKVDMMKTKKTIKTVAAMLTTALLLVACDKAEPSRSYFIQLQKPRTGDSYMGVRYANEISDSVVFYSSTSWAITAYMGAATWLKFNGEMSGKGEQLVKLGVTMEPNKTGSMREAYYRASITGTDEEAYATFAFQQLATRIDGTMGNAPLVKQIDGSDGSRIDIDWDEMSRPTHITMKAGLKDLDMGITYREQSSGSVEVTFNTNKNIFVYGDTTYSVNNLTTTGLMEDSRFNGTKNVILIPRLFTGFEKTGDASMQKQAFDGKSEYASVRNEGGYSAFGDGLYNVSFENALMVRMLLGGFTTIYGVYYNGKFQLYADEEHRADSIAVVRISSNGNSRYEKYDLEYSNIDGRSTSVDVNQLIEGVEQCDPLMLLSFFKLARQTSVIKKATGRYNTYTVDAKTRSDGSVESMTVKDKNGKEIVYTLRY